MTHTFRTEPVGLGTVPAKYQLSIRAPNQQFSELASYTFPITPSQLRMDRSSLSSFTDTQGPASAQGVTRVMDVYGLAPPVYTLEGTTGWDRHLADGYILTGLQSMQLLAKFLAQYATLNQTQRASGKSSFYTLEFYDYFLSMFYVVEPIGPQVFRMSADRPLVAYYRFRWAAVKPAGTPTLGQIAALASLVIPPAAQAVVNAAQTVGAVAASYGAVGAIGSVSDTLSSGVNYISSALPKF